MSEHCTICCSLATLGSVRFGGLGDCLNELGNQRPKSESTGGQHRWAPCRRSVPAGRKPPPSASTFPAPTGTLRDRAVDAWSNRGFSPSLSSGSSLTASNSISSEIVLLPRNDPGEV